MKRTFNLGLSAILAVLLLAACGSQEGVPETSPTAAASAASGGQQTIAQQGFDSDESDGLQASVTSATSVLLTWNPVEGADGFADRTHANQINQAPLSGGLIC
jgi:ABC-type glycerol-3-phosphate transport system substrate-binding protein